MRVTRLVQTHIPVYKTKKHTKTTPFWRPLSWGPQKSPPLLKTCLLVSNPFQNKPSVRSVQYSRHQWFLSYRLKTQRSSNSTFINEVKKILTGKISIAVFCRFCLKKISFFSILMPVMFHCEKTLNSNSDYFLHVWFSVNETRTDLKCL